MKIIRMIIAIISIILGVLMLTNKNLIIEYPAIPYIIMGMGFYHIVDAVYVYARKKKNY